MFHIHKRKYSQLTYMETKTYLEKKIGSELLVA